MKVRVVDLDSNHKLYIYLKKSILKKRMNGGWVSVVVARDPSEMLNSNVINDDLKQRLKKILEQIT
jgi:RNase P protein component